MIPAMMLIVPQFVLAKWLGLIDTLPGLIVFYIANLALSTFLLRGFFEALPQDSTTRCRSMARPHGAASPACTAAGAPTLATATIFTSSPPDEYAWALTAITSPENKTLPIAVALLQGPRGTQWGLVFAASIIAILPVIVVFLIFQRHFVQGLTAGAVKG